MALTRRKLRRRLYKRRSATLNRPKYLRQSSWRGLLGVVLSPLVKAGGMPVVLRDMPTSITGPATSAKLREILEDMRRRGVVRVANQHNQLAYVWTGKPLTAPQGQTASNGVRDPKPQNAESGQGNPKPRGHRRGRDLPTRAGHGPKER